MNVVPLLLSLVASTSAVPAQTAAAHEPLACRLDALSPAQRARHQKLTALLRRAVVETRELADGWELALDLSRLPADAQGEPVCVVEIAEWVDLEARCCPFLDFGLRVRGKGAGSVALALTGGPGVKEFVAMELAPESVDRR
jgi:hypothetical protein